MPFTSTLDDSLRGSKGAVGISATTAVSPGAGISGTVAMAFSMPGLGLLLMAQIAAKQTMSTIKSVMTIRLAVSIRGGTQGGKCRQKGLCGGSVYGIKCPFHPLDIFYPLPANHLRNTCSTPSPFHAASTFSKFRISRKSAFWASSSRRATW
jgi:hypothetical protein